MYTTGENVTDVLKRTGLALSYRLVPVWVAGMAGSPAVWAANKPVWGRRKWRGEGTGGGKGGPVKSWDTVGHRCDWWLPTQYLIPSGGPGSLIRGCLIHHWQYSKL